VGMRVLVEVCAVDSGVDQVRRREQIYRMEQLDKLGDFVGQRLWLITADIVNKPHVSRSTGWWRYGRKLCTTGCGYLLTVV
jgi:hypothetical protein